MSTKLPQASTGRLRAARALLGALTAAGVGIGTWASAAPAGFYRNFPGFGRHWLPPLGPYNEHLVRDYGALNLGLGAAALIAAICLTRSATAAATAAWIVYSIPHTVFHATHGEFFSAGDDAAALASLISAALTALLALWLVLTGQGGRSGNELPPAHLHRPIRPDESKAMS